MTLAPRIVTTQLELDAALADDTITHVEIRSDRGPLADIEVTRLREIRDVRVAVTAPALPGVIDGRQFQPDAVEVRYTLHAGDTWQVERCQLLGDLVPLPGSPRSLHRYRGHRDMIPTWHPTWPEWLRRVVDDLHPGATS